MFNQPHSARAAVPWQPHAGIARKLSDRGYAATRWTDAHAPEFADVGYPDKPSGFSAAHYQPTRQSLSQQAQASLALLEGEYRNDAFGNDASATDAATEDPNAHLPFVFDAYAATRKSKLRVHVEANVLERALAHAELAETLVVSPITTDEAVPEPIVIHPDVPDADVPVLNLEASDDAVVDVELSEPASEPLADVVAVDDVAPEPELPMVAGGVSPEDVAQREAEQFAKGLAQAREEAAVALAEAVRVATEEAMVKGLAQGHAEGLTQGKEEGLAEGLAQGQVSGHAQGLEEGKTQGFDEGKAVGLAEGEAKVRAELADEMAAQRVVFETAAQELHALIADPKQFFEPLKRLAMHIAEQVVLGELKTSSQALDRLVQRCLDELDHPVQGAVVLELNPQDKALLQAQGGEFTKGMRLEAMHDMPRGSVRVFANDTVIEDLVTHRLEGLAQSLLVDVPVWRETSTLMQAEPIEVEQVTTEVTEDGDVHS